MANVISMDKKIAVLTALVEGCSVRSTVRMTGVSKGAVLRLLVAVGQACIKYQDRVIRNVTAKRVQVDEIWSFVRCKQKNVTEAKMEAGICGDVWTFTAIEAQSKLILSWMAGRRDAGCATEFLQDVASRLANRVQLTTDGHKMYLTAVPDAFADDIDYAQLVKVYGNDPEGATRCSPAQCLGTKREPIIGTPELEHISTHVAMLALFHMHCNFCRIDQTLRVTPAMEAGISQHPWSIQEIASLPATLDNALAA